MSLETIAAPAVAESQSASDVRPLAPLPKTWRSPARAFVHQARARPASLCVVDSTGQSLTYGETFLRAVALGRVLKRTLGPSQYVGVMIPPTVHGALANIALALLGKIAVNLNYTAGQNLVDSSIEQCEITHVLTSRRVLDKFKVKPAGELILLEDIPKKVTTADKIFAATVAKGVPIAAMGLFLRGLRGDCLDDVATVIFTSGSTGDPKGVVLSNRNILTNIHQYEQHVGLTRDEVILGILPFFHSFGFNVPLWAVLSLGFTGVYHFSPLDAKIIGHLCREYKVTILLATPTFLQSYAKRCDRDQFATLKLPIVGAEKLRPEVASQIHESLGLDVLEGYGCTELSPIVAVNTHRTQTTADGRTVPGNKPGTVGIPVPLTSIKTVDPETGQNLPRGMEGIVHVKGPQVMVGYLNRAEDTARVLKDGWYSTGDLGSVDADGFLSITGRLSRFSKIAGEMVPHEGVERAVIEAAGMVGHEVPCVAVTAIPDPKRQERLVVVHIPLAQTPADLCKILSAGPLPKLWLPSPEDFVQVDAIPLLGSGKLDLRAIKAIANEKLGQHKP